MIYSMDKATFHNEFIEALRSNNDNILNKLYAIEKEEKEIIAMLLIKFGRLPSKWVKDRNSYYLLTVSAKKNNQMQLTLFNNNMPVFDMIRDTASHNDIINEIYNNRCTLETVNYIQ